MWSIAYVLLLLLLQYWDALKICMEQHVAMTEDLVEKLTPSKEMGEANPDEKNKILEGVAEVCSNLDRKFNHVFQNFASK